VQYHPKGKSHLVLTGLGAVAVLGLGVSIASAQSDGPYPVVETTQAPASAKPRAAVTPKPALSARQQTAVASAKPEASVPSVESSRASVEPGAKPAAASSATPYFVEFRSRHALSYGHTYLVHGRVGQKITPKDVIGLHPATESSVPWMIGHLIPVVSETGASDGDADEKYVSARYRVLLTKAEYAKLVAFMDKLKARSPLWHAAMYNCNAFVGDIARYVGLESPSHFLYPKEFITEMRLLNKGRTRVAATAPLYSAQE
jgi:hypothetical protein